MADESEPQYVDSSRLKQVNLELGGLASKHKACQRTAGFSAWGGGARHQPAQPDPPVPAGDD
ncbi:MAG: hypothetical protein H6962_08085 [Chromatiaceae bacterium]|nr:hypothetical protein [Chromatiaceae bacterium]